MEPELDHDNYRPPEPSRIPSLVAALVVIAVVIAGGYYLWQRQQPAPVPEAVPVAAAPVAPSTPSVPAADAPPAAPPPGDTAAPEASDTARAKPLPALADAGPRVREVLERLLGRQNVLTHLQTDRFVTHAVATVDNLAREQAPVAVWPVNPTPQRFATLRQGGNGEIIHPDNSRRYQPLVGLIESVDTAQAVSLYRSHYPWFQKAFEELGFPGRSFNDRLVQVMDHLIATPVPAQPPAVQLVEVKGSVPSQRPWVRYEFADPQLQAQSAGRKILLRVGPDNQRRLQAKLADLRQQLAKP